MFQCYEEVSKNMVNNINRKIRKISKTFGMNLLPYEVPTSGVCHHMYWVMDEDYIASYAWLSAKAWICDRAKFAATGSSLPQDAPEGRE